MNILFVNRMLATQWGGGENYDYNLAVGLARLGHRAVFLSARPPGVAAPDRIGELDLVSLPVPYVRKYMYRLAGKLALVPGLFAEADLQVFRYAARGALPALVRRYSIDVVQVLSLPFLAEDAARQGYPVVMRFPGPPAWFHSSRLRRLAGRRRAAMFTHGDAVGFMRKRLGVPVEEVPPGVEADLYRPPASEPDRLRLRRQLGMAADEFALVSVGRLIEGKGHGFLLRAMRLLAAEEPGLRLFLVGDGALRKRLERQAAEAGLGSRVVFTGNQPRESVARFLAAADVFCLFSDYENYSNAVLEAMSSGLPVLASRVGGFPLQVRDGDNGFLLDGGDLEGCRVLVRRLARDRALRERLSQGARAFASRFCWRASAERAARIYERVLS